MTDAAPEQEPFTLQYAAAWLKVSESWLAKQAREHRVPHIHLGRRRLFMQTDLERILAINRAEVASGWTGASAAAKRREADKRARARR